MADSLESVWPAYCFEDNEPVLVASHENGTITNSYGQARKFQNHNFPEQIEISYVGKKRVEAQLEDLREVDAGDVAFTPSPEAREYVPQTTTTIVQALPLTPLHLKHRVDPVYPQSARAAQITGTVVVVATIDKNGRVKDAKIVSSPDVSLSAAALDAVRQWRYEPVIVNGQPYEMHTQIRLEFTL
jgi:TonB family protein